MLAGPLAFVGLFFVYPLVSILAEGMRRSGDPWSLIEDVASDPDLRGVVLFTLFQAVLSTVLTLAIGLVGAAVLGRYRLRGGRLLTALVTVPFVLPTVVVALAFRELLGSRGLVPILIAHAFFNVAVVVRTVGGYWARLDPAPAEAAAMLGAPPWRVLTTVTLPRLRPAIAAASAIVFGFCFTSFGVVLLLGTVGTSTIEVEIHRQALFLFELPIASVLAVVQLVLVGLVLVVQAVLERDLVRRQGAVVVAGNESPGGVARVVAPLAAAALAVFSLTPLAVVVSRSLRVGSGWGLDNYRNIESTARGTTLFVSSGEAIANSLTTAVAAALLAVALGLAVAAALADGRAASWVQALALVPLATSAVTLGLGMLIALDEGVLDFRGEWWLVPVAQALVATPFVLRLVLPRWVAVRTRLSEAAAVLGAAPAQRFWSVELPLIRPMVVAAAGFALAVALGEFGATVFVAPTDRPTVPVAIFRALGRPGAANLGQAMALSTILMFLTLASVLAVGSRSVGSDG